MRKRLRCLVSSVYQTYCPVEIEHDVFISFRGKDVRNGLCNDLVKELRAKEIDVYVDDKLERGDDILPTLLRKIERSQILLVILSPNYASSTWCLEELSKMVKCCESDNKQILIPIFYEVSPSDVREQEQGGSYGYYLAEHKKNENKFKVRIWRSALKKAATSAGFRYSSKDHESEDKLVEAIVKDVLEKVNPDARDSKPRLRRMVLCTLLFAFLIVLFIFLIYVCFFVLF